MKILIVGGGVIGTSIAYFLSRRGAEPIVIERTGIACAASGKSGGFLALDWCDGTPPKPKPVVNTAKAEKKKLPQAERD